MPNQGKGHAVHLDNLFTSSKLLTTLRQRGIGAAGTVRTGQTRREANDENRQREQSLLEPAQDDAEDEDLDLDLDQDHHSFNDPNVQHQLNLLNTIIEDMSKAVKPKSKFIILSKLVHNAPQTCL